jgi:hypothetical protein
MGSVLAACLYVLQNGGDDKLQLVRRIPVAIKADLLKRITIEPGKCRVAPAYGGRACVVVDVLELLSSGADQIGFCTTVRPLSEKISWTA